jgi:DHA3 family tetracycline resistance protein-like MFS transporter
MPNKIPAYPLYLIIQGSFWLFFAMMATLSAIYRVESAGLNPMQLILVGTVLEVSIFIFEIPTGIVADIYSRRASVVVGYLLIGLGFMLEGSFPLFGTILLAQFIWGIGATFTSGAEEAWLADEVGEDRLAHIYLRGSQFAQAGGLAGILVSVLLGRIALDLPIFFGGACIVGLAIFLALFMPETGFRPTLVSERNTWHSLSLTFKDGVKVVRSSPILKVMMAIALIYGLSSEGLDRLWEAHILANFTFPSIGGLEPVVWFGIINVVQTILVIIAAEIIRRRVRVENHLAAVRALTILTTMLVISLIVFGLAPGITLAILSIWSVSVLRRTSMPLYSAWLNKGLQPATRATVLSISGQIDAIGQLVGGPIIGAVAMLLGLRAAMIGVALLLAPAVFLYGFLSRMIGGSPPIQQATLEDNQSIPEPSEP